ncbi:uncharacterized protein LOC115623170 [Scaptodrosophila lebanonensis]|uniref:Uncharacterized protein LOC115623170 n=1 Tax=Drosophila lebanonensis TaxID=7225 RepID=A0A6J2TE32_DROLE|nr:uncharacterized protein LOC115623170 [Scaptodrosophila lebanonensis]
MLWKILIFLCFLAIMPHQVAAAKDDKKNSTKLSPNITEIPPPIDKALTTYELKYIIGAHKFGEFLAFEKKSAVFLFGSKHNPQIAVGYPDTGDGFRVSAVDVVSIQDSKTGELVITRGGPGVRQIEVSISASQTKLWFYHIKVYGTLW